MFDVIIHHGKCLDGFTAAWIASKFNPHARLIAGSYGTPFDTTFLVGREIIMVDFSLPRQQMIDLAACNKLVVLDHHKTAEANLKGLDFCTFDMERSGAGLTWDYFCEHEPNMAREIRDHYKWVDQYVHYVQDRDLWKFVSGYTTKAINAALGTYEYTLEAYTQFVLNGFEAARHLGECILRMQEKQILENLEKVYYVEFAGHKDVAVVNCSEMSIISELLNRACKNHPFAIAWRVGTGSLLNPFKIYLSLRSDDAGVDVSEIAKKFGGGGHIHAAGAEIGLEQIDTVLPYRPIVISSGNTDLTSLSFTN